MAASTFTWKIENYSKLTAKVLTSDTFVMYGHQWCIEVYPKGDAEPDYLALYLAVANPQNSSGWNIIAEFSLILINQINAVHFKRNSAECTFGEKRRWGYPKFIRSSELCDRTAGFLVHDVLIVQALIAVKSNFSVIVKSETSLKDSTAVKPENFVEHFANLFDDISRVVGTSFSSRESTPDVDSLSLLKNLAYKSFSEIPCRLRVELPSTFELLAQATCLSSDQASAVTDFSSQYEELCQSYVSHLAVLQTCQQFFDSKDDTFLLLKTYSESQMKIKKTIDNINKETRHLKMIPKEAMDARSRLFENYGVIGKKAQVVKAEWDELVAKVEDMIGQREKAEKELAAIETKWTNFISLFKAEPEGVKDKEGLDEFIAKDEDMIRQKEKAKPEGVEDKAGLDEYIAKDEDMIGQNEEAESRWTRLARFISLIRVGDVKAA